MGETPDNIVPITSDALSAAERFGAEHNRELLTILFTDLVDSTQLQSKLGNVESARLTQLHREIVRDELAKYDAREIEWAGDSCLAVFTKPSDGVLFALRLQAALRDARLVEGNMPPVRIGLHLGEIVVRQNEGAQKEDLFGLQVSEAARVMSLARANQIYCTRAVFDNAQSSLKGRKLDGLQATKWINHGPFEMKGSDEPVEVCEVGEEGFAPLKAPEANDKCRPIKGDIQKWRKRRANNKGERLALTAGNLALILVAALALGAVISGVAVRQMMDARFTNADVGVNQSEADAIIGRFIVDIGVTRLMGFLPVRAELALSPDGRQIAYTANTDGVARLYIRDLDQLNASPVLDSEDVRLPFFSPDSRSVAYFGWSNDLNSMALFRKSLTSDKPQMVCAVKIPVGGTWLENGSIVFAGQINEVDPVPHLHRISTTGGKPELIFSLDTETGNQYHSRPFAIPGTNSVLFTIDADEETRHVALLDMDTKKHTPVVHNAYGAEYAASGHIVFVRNDGFWGVPFDAGTGAVTGKETQIHPEHDLDVPWGAKPFALSREGSLLFIPNLPERTAKRMLVWVNRDDGRQETLAVPIAAYYMPRVSPDGTRIVVGTEDPENEDLYVHEIDDPGSLIRRTFEPSPDRSPVWTRDSQEFFFCSFRNNGIEIYKRRADGTGGVELILEQDGVQAPAGLGHLEETLLYQELGEKGWAIGALVLAQGTPEIIVETGGSDFNPSLSPNGRWLVYDSGAEEAREVWVRPFPVTDETIYQVSTEGGEQPMWSPDGTEIFYRNGDKMMSVKTNTDEPTFAYERPELLFEGEYFSDSYRAREYDLEYPDAERFLMVTEVDSEPTTKLVYVSNWLEQLNRDVPPNPAD